ncbi:MAG: inositol monophosphatase family protein [Clostridiales bacterium]
MIELEKLCKDVIKVATEAGSFIAREAEHFNSASVEKKGRNNFVSFVDKASEEMIIKNLSSLLPGSGFLAEEGTYSGKREPYTWIIDPLDGTTNFIHGAPPYSVSIGLMDESKVILGVVYEITHRECFYSWEGAPSFLNDKKIKVSEAGKVGDSLVATGFPYTDYKLMQQALNFLEYLFVESHGVRRLGSAAADLAYVACGRYDLFYEYGLNPWDVAAGDIIIRNAGGKLTDFNGGNDYIFGKRIIASNSKTHEEFLHLIKKYYTQN